MALRYAVTIFFLLVAHGIARAQETTLDTDLIASMRARIIGDPAESLDALLELYQQPAIINSLVPELTHQLTTGGEPAKLLAVKCLGRIGVKAEPAVSALIKYLDHSDYKVRLEIINVLTNIGSPALPELTDALASTSPRVRAAALATINKFATVDANLLEKLESDPDSRVRCVVAQAWKQHGKQGVAKIVGMLNDSEASVAASAAESLRYNYEDSTAAIANLQNCLNRKGVGIIAADVLRTFGTEAQGAIPKLIQAYPLGRRAKFGDWNEDAAELALQHIGTPRLSDLEALRELLADKNPNIGNLAATAIGSLGTDAFMSAGELDNVFQSSLISHDKISEWALQIDDELERDDFIYENDGHQKLCKTSCMAFFQVSRDMERFIQMLETMTKRWEKSIYWGIDSPFTYFTKDEVPSLIDLLRSDNEHLSETAWDAIEDIPNNVIQQKDVDNILALDPSKSSNIYRLIAKADNRTQALLLPWLIDGLETGSLSLEEFVDIASSLSLRDPKVEQILQNGLESSNLDLANESMLAIAKLAGYEKEVVMQLIGRTDTKKKLRRPALEILLRQNEISEEALPFAIDCLRDFDFYENLSTLSILARLGPAATKALPDIEVLASRKGKREIGYGENQLQLRVEIAKACITGDKSHMDLRFANCLTNRTEDGHQDRGSILASMTTLGPQAAFFMDEIVEVIKFASANRDTDEYTLKEGVKLLAVIGEERAMQLLKSYSDDRDWKVRCMARKFLEQMAD